MFRRRAPPFFQLSGRRGPFAFFTSLILMLESGAVRSEDFYAGG